jgi:phospholipid/cholesterol/gamma-HCH transport system permease protein
MTIPEKDIGKRPGINLQDFFFELADTFRFAGKATREMFRRPFEGEELLNQCYLIGYKTLALISITAFIMGLVLTLQTFPMLEDLGAEAELPGLICVSILREIGPVITALIFAGKVGSGLGAELGSMRVSDQIDAMEVSGTNPMKFLVSTRVLATTLMVPILVIFSDAVGLVGSYIGINLQGTVSVRLFIINSFEDIRYYDIFPAIIKSFFFGYAIGLIGCYKGYTTTGGTQGVGKAANSAVVISSVVVFIIDLIAVQLAELVI